VSSRAPTASGKADRESRLSSKIRFAGTRAGIPIRRLTKKTHRQLCQSTSRPPSDGPAAAATAPVAPQSAVAVARCSSGNSGRTSASDAGTSSAAPSAWTTRAPIRSSTEFDAPQTTDAARKRNTPRKKKRRRPYRSASRPAGTRAAANTIVYALMIHESWASELSGNDVRMSGNAMLTIVTSRKLMNTPTDVTRSTCQRRANALLPAT
jgi:hypothetical protein